MQKYASNVVEKIIQNNATWREKFYDKILLSRDVMKLIADQYANYVIQTCLTCCNPQYKEKFINWLRPCMKTLQTTSYGRKILAYCGEAGVF